jgi:hypothetical protein
MLKKSKIDRKLAQSLLTDISRIAELVEEGKDTVLTVELLLNMVKSILDHTVNLTALNMGYKATGRITLLKQILESRK